MRFKKLLSVVLVIVMLFSFSSLTFATDTSLRGSETIDGVLSTTQINELNKEIKSIDENASEITNVKKIVSEDGSEEFIVEFKLTPQSDKNSRRLTALGFGMGNAHFSRTSLPNQWQCYFTISLSEPITQADYQLYWGIGYRSTYSDFTGLGTQSAVSATHKNIYTKAGAYRPTCSIQVWGASGPYGTIQVPNINVIAILSDL